MLVPEFLAQAEVSGKESPSHPGKGAVVISTEILVSNPDKQGRQEFKSIDFGWILDG